MLVSSAPLSPKTSPTATSAPIVTLSSTSPDILLPDDQVQQLVAKIEQLEYELGCARGAASDSPTILPPTAAQANGEAATTALEVEKAAHAARVADLESRITAAEVSSKTEQGFLKQQLFDANTAIDKVKEELESQAAQNADLEATVVKLQSEVNDKSKSLADVNTALDQSKDSLKALQEKFVKSSEEFRGEKVELTMQVDELRLAGQVSK